MSNKLTNIARERLLLPKDDTVVDSMFCAKIRDYAVPTGDVLPVWKRIPLQNKIPMYRGPETGTQLSKIREVDYGDYCFYVDTSLAQPKLSYDPLQDPCLRQYFQKPQVKRILTKTGRLKDGDKLQMSLAEYNKYRSYVREMCLRGARSAMDKRPEDQKIPEFAQARCQSAPTSRKDAKVERVKARAKYLNNLRQQKFSQMNAETERKREHYHQMLRENRERKAAMSDEDERQRAYSERRSSLDQRRIVPILTKWKEEKARREEKLLARKYEDAVENEEKMMKQWDDRMTFQIVRYEAEDMKRQQLENIKKENVSHRNKEAMKSWNKVRESLYRRQSHWRKTKNRDDLRFAESLVNKLNTLGFTQVTLNKPRSLMTVREPIVLPYKYRSRFKSLWILEDVVRRMRVPHFEGHQMVLFMKSVVLHTKHAAMDDSIDTLVDELVNSVLAQLGVTAPEFSVSEVTMSKASDLTSTESTAKCLVNKILRRLSKAKRLSDLEYDFDMDDEVTQMTIQSLTDLTHIVTNEVNNDGDVPGMPNLVENRYLDANKLICGSEEDVEDSLMTLYKDITGGTLTEKELRELTRYTLSHIKDFAEDHEQSDDACVVDKSFVNRESLEQLCKSRNIEFVEQEKTNEIPTITSVRCSVPTIPASTLEYLDTAKWNKKSEDSNLDANNIVLREPRLRLPGVHSDITSVEEHSDNVSSSNVNLLEKDKDSVQSYPTAKPKPHRRLEGFFYHPNRHYELSSFPIYYTTQTMKYLIEDFFEAQEKVGLKRCPSVDTKRDSLTCIQEKTEQTQTRSGSCRMNESPSVSLPSVSNASTSLSQWDGHDFLQQKIEDVILYVMHKIADDLRKGQVSDEDLTKYALSLIDKSPSDSFTDKYVKNTLKLLSQDPAMMMDTITQMGMYQSGTTLNDDDLNLTVKSLIHAAFTELLSLDLSQKEMSEVTEDISFANKITTTAIKQIIKELKVNSASNDKFHLTLAPADIQPTELLSAQVSKSPTLHSVSEKSQGEKQQYMSIESNQPKRHVSKSEHYTQTLSKYLKDLSVKIESEQITPPELSTLIKCSAQAMGTLLALQDNKHLALPTDGKSSLYSFKNYMLDKTKSQVDKINMSRTIVESLMKSTPPLKKPDKDEEILSINSEERNTFLSFIFENIENIEHYDTYVIKIPSKNSSGTSTVSAKNTMISLSHLQNVAKSLATAKRQVGDDQVGNVLQVLSFVLNKIIADLQNKNIDKVDYATIERISQIVCDEKVSSFSDSSGHKSTHSQTSNRLPADVKQDGAKAILQLLTQSYTEAGDKSMVDMIKNEPNIDHDSLLCKALQKLKNDITTGKIDLSKLSSLQKTLLDWWWGTSDASTASSKAVSLETSDVVIQMLKSIHKEIASMNKTGIHASRHNIKDLAQEVFDGIQEVVNSKENDDNVIINKILSRIIQKINEYNIETSIALADELLQEVLTLIHNTKSQATDSQKSALSSYIDELEKPDNNDDPDADTFSDIVKDALTHISKYAMREKIYTLLDLNIDKLKTRASVITRLTAAEDTAKNTSLLKSIVIKLLKNVSKDVLNIDQLNDMAAVCATEISAFCQNAGILKSRDPGSTSTLMPSTVKVNEHHCVTQDDLIKRTDSGNAFPEHTQKLIMAQENCHDSKVEKHQEEKFANTLMVAPLKSISQTYNTNVNDIDDQVTPTQRIAEIIRRSLASVLSDVDMEHITNEVINSMAAIIIGASNFEVVPDDRIRSWLEHGQQFASELKLVESIASDTMNQLVARVSSGSLSKEHVDKLTSAFNSSNNNTVLYSKNNNSVDGDVTICLDHMIKQLKQNGLQKNQFQNLLYEILDIRPYISKPLVNCAPIQSLLLDIIEDTDKKWYNVIDATTLSFSSNTLDNVNSYDNLYFAYSNDDGTNIVTSDKTESQTSTNVRATGDKTKTVCFANFPPQPPCNKPKLSDQTNKKYRKYYNRPLENKKVTDEQEDQNIMFNPYLKCSSKYNPQRCHDAQYNMLRKPQEERKQGNDKYFDMSPTKRNNKITAVLRPHGYSQERSTVKLTKVNKPGICCWSNSGLPTINSNKKDKRVRFYSKDNCDMFSSNTASSFLCAYSPAERNSHLNNCKSSNKHKVGENGVINQNYNKNSYNKLLTIGSPSLPNPPKAGGPSNYSLKRLNTTFSSSCNNPSKVLFGLRKQKFILPNAPGYSKPVHHGVGKAKLIRHLRNEPSVSDNVESVLTNAEKIGSSSTLNTTSSLIYDLEDRDMEMIETAVQRVLLEKEEEYNGFHDDGTLLNHSCVYKTNEIDDGVNDLQNNLCLIDPTAIGNQTKETVKSLCCTPQLVDRGNITKSTDNTTDLDQFKRINIVIDGVHDDFCCEISNDLCISPQFSANSDDRNANKELEYRKLPKLADIYRNDHDSIIQKNSNTTLVSSTSYVDGFADSLSTSKMCESQVFDNKSDKTLHFSSNMFINEAMEPFEAPYISNEIYLNDLNIIVSPPEQIEYKIMYKSSHIKYIVFLVCTTSICESFFMNSLPIANCFGYQSELIHVTQKVKYQENPSRFAF